jgi:hypothetical protein
MVTALRWQIDLDFPQGRTWGLICVQCFPVKLNGLPGPGGQVVYRTPCNQNGWKFWHVAAIPVVVAFDDQRICSNHLVDLLDTSLAQNRAICAGPNVVAEFPRHNGNPAVGIPEHTMVAGGPDVTPAGFFQCPDQFTNLDSHKLIVRCSLLYRLTRIPEA